MAKAKKKKTNADVMKKITDRVIEALKGGRIAWQKPWVNKVLPMNYISKKAYKGINLWLTFFAPYESPYWLTYKQAKGLGGQVRKGEKGTQITFWKIIKKPILNDDGTPKLNRLGNPVVQKIFLLKDFTVFNAEQIDGIEFTDPNEIVEGAESVKTADELVDLYTDKPKISHTNEPKAYYAYGMMGEFINMPKMDTFKSTEGYYSTLFHELTHSTGHTSRLDRESLMTRTKDNYSKEELVAEMGACLMMAKAGLAIEPSDNSKAYLQGWISKLENDHSLIFKAARDAQKACDYMMGIAQAKDSTEDSTEADKDNNTNSMAA